MTGRWIKFISFLLGLAMSPACAIGYFWIGVKESAELMRKLCGAFIREIQAEAEKPEYPGVWVSAGLVSGLMVIVVSATLFVVALALG